MKNHIIIGSSAVAIGAILQLQKNDPNSKITCITKSSYHPYNTCFLAQYLDGRKKKEELLFDAKLFLTHNTSFIKNKTVIKINPIKQTITLNSGEEIFFDTLTLGIGTDNFTPNFIGPKNIEGISFFKTLEDADYILNQIKTQNIKNVTIVGTGLVGMEVAESLANLGLQINLIGRTDHVMTKLFDEQASTIIEKNLDKKKINFYKNSQLLEVFEKNNKINSIKIRSKYPNGITPVDETITPSASSHMQGSNISELEPETIPSLSSSRMRGSSLTESTPETIIKTDLLIFATGNTPNLPLAKDAKIVTEENGIIINEYFQTNFKNIYAGGDVCLVKNALNDSKIQSCTWPDAIIHGINIANSITSMAKPYLGILISFNSEIFNTKFAICGNYLSNENKNHKIITKIEGNVYKKFVIQNDKLIGFLLLGDNLKSGIYRKMILDQTIITEKISSSF